MSEAALGSAGRVTESLIRASLAPGTWLAYSQAWQQWVEWREAVGLVGEGDDMAVLLYVGHCRESGWSIARISRCMAGLAFGFRLRARPDATKCFLVAQALKGWKRGQVVEDRRRPVSFRLLQDLGGQLGKLCWSVFEECLFRLAFSLAFFGALRLGELVSPSTKRPGGLMDEDMDLFEDRVEFALRRSKTDQLGRGKRVVVFAVPGSTLCPVDCLRRYRSLKLGVFRPRDPLLVHEDGSFLSRYQFVGVFRKGVRALGLSSEDYSGHFFRIGAATEAARLGMGDDVIKRIGRWESIRFRSYVRLDKL